MQIIVLFLNLFSATDNLSRIKCKNHELAIIQNQEMSCIWLFPAILLRSGRYSDFERLRFLSMSEG